MDLATIVMPCFNHGQFLEESVQAIVRQTYFDWELIIVDDCSMDNSWEVMSALARKDSRITVIRHDRNLGPSKSRNDGMRAAKGEFFGFCDSDDIWEADKLETQVRILEENKDCDVTYCDALFIDESGRPTGKRFSQLFPVPGSGSGQLFDQLVSRNFINTQTVLMRRDCVKESGYFDEGIRLSEDWWYWLTISRSHRFIYSPKPLARYRVHSKSTGFTRKRGYSISRCRMYRRLLEQDPSLSRLYRARIFYIMGVDLCRLGKRRAGRRLFWNAAALAMTDMRAFNTFWKALARTVISSKTIPFTAVPRAGAAKS